MSPADRHTIERKLEYLRRSLKNIEPLRSLAEGEFLSSERDMRAAERILQTAIESVLDASRLLVIVEDWRRIKDEREALLILPEHGVIDEDLTLRLLQAKKFRNVLVHLYTEVDPKLVYKHLRDGCEELAAFATALATWLQKH